VLDLGAGEGYVAAALRARTGASVVSADVGPFARAGGPYVVFDGRRLPLAAGAVDTTLVLLTLHHCADPERVLDEAVRVTRHRLLVTESVSRNRRDRFWLDLLDGRVNRLRHAGRMPPALGFRSPEEWQRLFAARALEIRAIRRLGSPLERLIHHPVLYVLDVPRPERRRTEDEMEEHGSAPPRCAHAQPARPGGGGEVGLVRPVCHRGTCGHDVPDAAQPQPDMRTPTAWSHEPHLPAPTGGSRG
jgi:SAM-dependent methyltransferase